jgi:diketogulonate reductase-like aldo/keto reductase
MKYFTLNDGLVVPAVGFGTYKITDQESMSKAIESAFENGYEYIDTAKLYNNEAILGKELKNAPVKREDYKLATKVWPNMFGTELTKKSLDDSLKDLQVDYIDVVHLHRFGEKFEESWKVFEDYKRQGIVKSIAVCNFYPEQLEKLFKVGEKPSIDQLESSPHFENGEVVSYLKDHGILHEAWSPLTAGKSGLLEEEALIEIGKKYGKTPAQIALKWNVDRGTMVIPKSTNPGRIKENISIFDFELDDEDRKKIKSINKEKRYGKSPLDPEWLKEIANR